MNPGAGRLVVVADDDAGVRRLIAHHLRSLGCDVLQAPDGEEAVRLALEREPDLLVLDVAMPGLTGYEVTRELRTRLSTRVPVLLISGSVRSADVSEGFEAGADAYLRKPFSGDELLESVAVLLATTANGGHRPG
jgi:two-component system, OmpR family, response regulator ResD